LLRNALFYCFFFLFPSFNPCIELSSLLNFLLLFGLLHAVVFGMKACFHGRGRIVQLCVTRHIQVTTWREEKKKGTRNKKPRMACFTNSFLRSLLLSRTVLRPACVHFSSRVLRPGPPARLIVGLDCLGSVAKLMCNASTVSKLPRSDRFRTPLMAEMVD